MANWKKVAVSGSNVHLNNVHALDGFASTDRSASISCSGNWFGNLPEADNQEIVVVYDTLTGQFKQRPLSDIPGAPGYGE